MSRYRSFDYCCILIMFCKFMRITLFYLVRQPEIRYTMLHGVDLLNKVYVYIFFAIIFSYWYTTNCNNVV